MASLGRAMTEADRRPDLVAEMGKLRVSIAPLCSCESVSRMPLLEATRALARVQ
jgi:hypothetical protein